jgi:L-alanine-DL-glutamate epimerase-like enolase superfamily enzyme
VNVVEPSGLNWSRRRFLKVTGGAAFLSGLFPLAIAEKAHAKITDIQTMTLAGQRTYVYVKVVADDGHYGIAEAYGTPSIGVKEQIQALKPLLVGKNPLEIDAIYTYMGIGGPELSGTRTDGSAHSLMRAASGIEMALWDLAGKILGVPTSTLLGGKFRDQVRVYDHAAPRNMPLAVSGRTRSRQIPAALPHTSSAFLIQTRRATAPGILGIECLRPKN